jgi:hypothetical protein
MEGADAICFEDRQKSCGTQGSCPLFDLQTIPQSTPSGVSSMAACGTADLGIMWLDGVITARCWRYPRFTV